LKLNQKLTGKKSHTVVFIEYDDRLKTWKTHFKNLLNTESHDQTELDPVTKVFELSESIKY